MRYNIQWILYSKACRIRFNNWLRVNNGQIIQNQHWGFSDFLYAKLYSESLFLNYFHQLLLLKFLLAKSNN